MNAKDYKAQLCRQILDLGYKHGVVNVCRKAGINAPTWQNVRANRVSKCETLESLLERVQTACKDMPLSQYYVRMQRIKNGSNNL